MDCNSYAAQLLEQQNWRPILKRRHELERLYAASPSSETASLLETQWLVEDGVCRLALAQHLPLGMAMSLLHLRSRFLGKAVEADGFCSEAFRGLVGVMVHGIPSVWTPSFNEAVLLVEVGRALPRGPEFTVQTHPVLRYAPVHVAAFMAGVRDRYAPYRWGLESEAQRAMVGCGPGMTAYKALEAFHATETVHSAVLGATDILPPFRVRETLRPLQLAPFKLDEPADETEGILEKALEFIAELGSGYSELFRVLSGYCLGNALAMFEEVFPELLAQVQQAGSSAEPAPKVEAKAQSPFRRAPEGAPSIVQIARRNLMPSPLRDRLTPLLNEAMLHASAMGTAVNFLPFSPFEHEDRMRRHRSCLSVIARIMEQELKRFGPSEPWALAVELVEKDLRMAI